MKKLVLLFALMFCTVNFAGAVNWVPVTNEESNQIIYVDKDNIQFVKPDTSYYPIMFKKNDKQAVVSFVKSNYANNTIGVIREDDYNVKNYNPMYVYRSYQVFMRPVVDKSAVSYAHKFVSCIYTDSRGANSLCNNTPYIDEQTFINFNSPAAQAKMKADIQKKWKLSHKGKNKTAVVLVAIGENGALNGYNIIQSTGRELADRAIISAIELAAPYKNIQNINMKLIFRSKIKAKVVE